MRVTVNTAQQLKVGETHCDEGVISGGSSGAHTRLSKVILSRKGFSQPREQVLVFCGVC